MSIRYGLLALLEREPMHGYQLRSEFDAATGATWPLNVGQVYTTLSRLERDGLVEPRSEDGEGRVAYAITAAGRAELSSWFDAPVVARGRPRDELAIKLALAVTVPDIDVAAVIQRQRTATVRALQDLTRLKRDALGASDAGPTGLSWSLVLESMRFQSEAEIRWLDHCEGALSRAAAGRHQGSAANGRPAASTSGVRR